MKKITANNLVKVLDWMTQTDEINAPRIASREVSGAFQCEIKLPLIDKTVIGVGGSKIEAIDDATAKASLLIDEYVAANDYYFVTEANEENSYYLKEEPNGYVKLIIEKK